MRKRLASFRRVFSVVIACAIAFGPQVFPVWAAGPAGNVVIRGNVASADKATPIAGARVYAVHLDTKQVFTSSPSGAKGEYSITGLPFGYYDIAVETTDGLFLANRVINAPAGERVEISLMLGPPQPEDTEWWSAEPDRRIPGLDRVPDGVARIVEGRPVPGKVAATRAPASVADASGPTSGTAGRAAGGAKWLVPVLAGVGVVALGILVDRQDDKDHEYPASPFVPTR
jgi:hypothetical protein